MSARVPRAYDGAAAATPARNGAGTLPGLRQPGCAAGVAVGADVDVVKRFEAADDILHRDTGLSVVTSARIRGRAPHGFGHRSGRLGRSAAGDCA